MQQQRCALLHLRPHLRSHLPLKSSSFLPPKIPALSKHFCSLTLHHTTSNCTNQRLDHRQDHLNTVTHPHPSADNLSSFDNFQCSVPPVESPDAESHEKSQTSEEGIAALIRRFTSMWWVDFRAALGQRINVEGIVSSVSVFAKDRHLALPHVMVPDVRHIDWAELRRRGFRGVVFDKDNTITVPYAFTLWPPLEPSIHLCKSVFGNDIAVFSNSAGLFEYDHDGSKARALEKAIGIKVIRHRVKKPAGTAEEIEKHFGCKSSQLIMVGDRPFTDIVYGNRNGFLTILTNPLSVSEEPFIVRKVRKLEEAFVTYWFRRDLKPTNHSLLPDAMKCIKESTPV